MGKRKARPTAKKKQRAKTSSPKKAGGGGIGEYEIVDVVKFTCDKCGREVISHLLGVPKEHPITEKVRKEHAARSKKEHEESCLGSQGPKPEPHPRLPSQ